MVRLYTGVCRVAAEAGGERAVTAFAIVGKGFITVSYSSIYVVTTDNYPTSIRAAALGLGAAVARAGSMGSSFVGGILVRVLISRCLIMPPPP